MLLQIGSQSRLVLRTPWILFLLQALLQSMLFKISGDGVLNSFEVSFDHQLWVLLNNNQTFKYILLFLET